MSKIPPKPYTPYLAQRVDFKPVSSASPDWSKFEVVTSKRDSKLAHSRANFATASNFPFVDISIEEYTGESGGRKYMSLRLEADAMRALYEMLKGKYDPE